MSVDISIIIPYGYHSEELLESLRSALTTPDRVEIILVTNAPLRKTLGEIQEQCTIVESEQMGRGYFCSTGVRIAKGEVVLFLHADTTLPQNWYELVNKVMTDRTMAGGGFTTSFKSDHWFLRTLPRFYNWYSRTFNEYWGDHAIFMRRKILLPYLSQIEIPIMEDVEMSKIMRKHGRMILLPDPVKTSDMHFAVKGNFRHTVGALFYRFLYALGVSADRIHAMYYKRL